MDHEAPIELFREHPEVVPTLLSRLLHVELPYFSDVRVTDPGTRTVVATGKRSDAAVVLLDGKRPVLGAILEPQGKIDPDKHFSWPKYLGDLHAELHCDTYLIVLALTRSVARWAKEPIATFQRGRGLEPYVIGPDDLPRLESLPAACQEPWLAALTALVHAADEQGPAEALVALQAVKETAGSRQAFWLYELLRAIMTADRYRSLEKVIMLSPESYLPKTDWERMQFSRGKAEGTTEGIAEGKADSILELLQERGIGVSEEQRARIMAERDLPTLRRWLKRVLSIQSCSDLFT